MSAKYDIRIPHFGSLCAGDVVRAIVDENDKPSFQLCIHPNDVTDDETYVSVTVGQYWNYPHRKLGMADDSVRFTVSVIDVEGRMRFPSSLVKDDFFSIEWFTRLLTSDDFELNRIVRLGTLKDEERELLPDDVLTLRVEVSYHLSSLPSRITTDSDVVTIGVSVGKLLSESDRLLSRCLDRMEESLHKLREFFLEYANLQRLHEELMNLFNPSEYEARIEEVNYLFSNLSSNVSQRHGGRCTSFKLFREQEEEDHDRRIWKVEYHRENVEVGEILETLLEPSSKPRRTLRDGKGDWVENLQLNSRLFSFQRELKRCYANRSWWDRDREDAWTEERTRYGKSRPNLCLRENFKEMFELYHTVRGGQKSEIGLLKTASRFFTLFLNCLEITADLIFDINGVLLVWSQSVTGKMLPMRPKEEPPITEGPSTARDDEGCQQDEDRSLWNLTIETNDGGSHVVPFKEGSTTLGSKLVAASPVFERMLAYPLKESIERRIKLKHFDSTTVINFLSFVETGRLREDVDIEDCLALYSLADMYQVQTMLDVILDHLYKLVSPQDRVLVLKISHIDWRKKLLDKDESENIFKVYAQALKPPYEDEKSLFNFYE